MVTTSSRELHAEVTQELTRRREMATGVPIIETAAFISPPRDRTAAWPDRPPLPDPEVVVAPASSALQPSTVTEKRGSFSQLSVQTPAPPSGVVAATTPLEKSTTSNQVAAMALAPAPRSTECLPPSSATSPVEQAAVPFDIMLGTSGSSPQYGILGEANGRRIALDLNQTHTISLFGVQGGGKSYTLGSIAEMASLRIPNINLLPHPLATVIFHYSPTMDYKPEFTSMVAPNSDEAQLRLLSRCLRR